MKNKMMMCAGISITVLGALFFHANKDSAVKSASHLKNLIPIHKAPKQLPETAASPQYPDQVTPVTSLHAEAANDATERMREELNLDLREIQQRRFVEALNDPRANSAVKEEALRFMSDYLRKLTSYMKMRNQQVQAMMEKNNG